MVILNYHWLFIFVFLNSHIFRCGRRLAFLQLCLIEFNDLNLSHCWFFLDWIFSLRLLRQELGWMGLYDSLPGCELLHFYSAYRLLWFKERCFLLMEKMLCTRLAHRWPGLRGWFKPLMALCWDKNLIFICFIILFLKTIIILKLLLVLADFVGLKIVNHLEDVSCLLSCYFGFHPLHDHACRIYALYLLQECPIDFPSIVFRWSDSYVVDVHLANDIFARAGRMLLHEFFITMSRCDKLVLSGLAAIYVIVGVEERSIWKHPGHLPSLMYDKESCIFVDFLDLDHFVVLWHNFVLMMEELDKLLWGHSVSDNFKHC